jgi:elongation factor G
MLKTAGVQAALDDSPEAKDRGSTVDLNVATFKKGERILNVLDAPGFGEFIEETYKSVWASDIAVLVVHGEKGLEVQTEMAWNIIQRYQKPAIILINMMDHENSDYGRVVSELQDGLGVSFAPAEWPIVDSGKFVGIVDIIEHKAKYFDGNQGEVPDDIAPSVDSARDALIEGLSEVDDELMEHFLDGADIPADEIKNVIKEGVNQRAVFPVFASAATVEKSVELLRDMIINTTPRFREPKEGKGEFQGLIFNAASDQYLGTLAFTKVIHGTLHEGTEFTNLSKGTTEKVKDILQMSGEKPTKIEEAEPGDIVILTKLHDFDIGDTLCEKGNEEPLSLGKLPTPSFPRAIEPLTDADEEKMTTSLRELCATKATLSVTRDEVTHQTLFSGLGDTHLSVMIDRLKSRYGTNLKLEKPQIPYKETITRIAEADHKHRKQSGGRGQYGEVHLRIEPLERSSGFKFKDEVKGGVIPGGFIPAVEKGIVEGMLEGKHGFPQTDILAAVFYGSHHAVDSSEIAFKIAGAQAFRKAVDKAGPVLLEPVMKIDIQAPSEFTGDIMGSVSGKRGRVYGMEPMGNGWEHIEGEAPLAEVQDYALELKSITQGRATFSLVFLEYQPVMSEQLAEQLLAKENRGGGES